jgi:hypothetical protein
MITGVTNNSRLIELKKYVVGVPFARQYKGYGSWNVDGVDYDNSPSENHAIYYLGGIQFTDIKNDNIVTTIFAYNMNNDNNFINTPYYKNSNKDKIISNPKINDDVFISRNGLSAFGDNYKFEFIKNLNDLTTYAGGKYFNVINNS